MSIQREQRLSTKLDLTPEQKNQLVALHEYGPTVWSGILQGEEIQISSELKELGLVAVSPTQYHGNVGVSLTKLGKRYGEDFIKTGFKTDYEVRRI